VSGGPQDPMPAAFQVAPAGDPLPAGNRATRAARAAPRGCSRDCAGWPEGGCLAAGELPGEETDGRAAGGSGGGGSRHRDGGVMCVWERPDMQQYITTGRKGDLFANTISGAAKLSG
jgi:hypothetical protein